MQGADTAQSCAQRKDQDDSIIMRRLFQGSLLVVTQIDRQTLGSTAQITDTHGAGIAVSVHLTEGLHLHGAGKGNDHIRRHIIFCRDKSHNKKQGHFDHNNDLTPVDVFGIFVFMPDLLCHQNTKGKCHDRE